MKMKILVFEDPFYIYTELFVGSYRFPGCFRIVRKAKFRSVTMFVGLDHGGSPGRCSTRVFLSWPASDHSQGACLEPTTSFVDPGILDSSQQPLFCRFPPVSLLDSLHSRVPGVHGS
jgi:hypothetical protein